MPAKLIIFVLESTQLCQNSRQNVRDGFQNFYQCKLSLIWCINKHSQWNYSTIIFRIYYIVEDCLLSSSSLLTPAILNDVQTHWQQLTQFIKNPVSSSQHASQTSSTIFRHSRLDVFMADISITNTCHNFDTQCQG